MTVTKAGVGIVWRAGRPVIDPGWVRGLNAEQRAWVDENLRRNGFKLNGDKAEELNNANPGN